MFFPLQFKYNFVNIVVICYDGLSLQILAVVYDVFCLTVFIMIDFT